MKILNAEQIRQADAFTIENEPVASDVLMERAANRLFEWIRKRLQPHTPVVIFAGVGNNGGDGLVLARLLAQESYNVVAYLIRFNDKLSNDCQVNADRLRMLDEALLVEISDVSELPSLKQDAILVDALFGSGLNRPAKGLAEACINLMNEVENVVVAIDIPSGLYADQPVDLKSDAIVKADYTLSFQFPKLAFFLPENDLFVGRWEVLPIGLHPVFINEVKTQHHFLEVSILKPWWKARARFTHKGNYGHVLLIAGSADKTGAAILAAKACMRSGAGLLHVHLPSKACNPLQSAFPEAMISIDQNDSFFSMVPDLAPYNVVAAGPGIGTAIETSKALKLLIQNNRLPLVLDADALNILAENKTWLSFLPRNTILTPHPKEFERLAGKWQNSFERLELQRELSVRFGLILILKGAFTCVSLPDGKCFFNPTGNPGMATAGSGDVLTGIISGLLAQGYSPAKASLLGVYLHGLAGDLAAEQLGMESMLASDIISHLPKAIARIRE
ncbi:MAG: NAD(P)H-hydrate dehydratase [Bacteroidales bacterium]|jgi:NAD(P)H-hydrate epimerase|nr:NAD(P)H-hydrate dehydratase [Bacteroidales bacterium]HOI31427.1 NAD(P)H-hydrate dehydratase [Bacteroidales bacterium]